ncbi:motor activity [Bonamia ostreae]|uniref:Motor activity n=1 Tax=Bonamia ostreae TaxID=126728 RepID=A0ABV2AHG6_9EUKA
MTIKWHYVTENDETVGPVDENELKSLFAKKTISDKSYVWNGKTVKEWTPISNIPSLLSSVRPSRRAPPPPPKNFPSRSNFGSMQTQGSNRDIYSSNSRIAPPPHRTAPHRDQSNFSSFQNNSNSSDLNNPIVDTPRSGDSRNDLLSQIRQKPNLRSKPIQRPVSSPVATMRTPNRNPIRNEPRQKSILNPAMFRPMQAKKFGNPQRSSSNKSTHLNSSGTSSFQNVKLLNSN